MDPAAGGEGEVLRAGHSGDRDEAIGDDASGYNSPAGGGSYGDVGRDGTRSSGRPVRKRTKSAQGTPRQPPKGAAAAEDSRAGWSRGDLTGGSSDSHPEDRSASPPRANARPHRRGESDLVTDEALETAEAVASSRGLGEPPAADAARTSGRSASRRGAQRMVAAPAESWPGATGSAPSTINAVWTAAERQRFAARGGVAAAIASTASVQSSAAFNPEEALDVSEDAILALFGQNRTAVLRMAGLPLQKECEKDWKMRCAQAKEYEKQGRKVPSGFITPQWFFTFQYNRNLLLAAAPLKVHDIEQWAWMFARWAIADASDMCKDSEFSQILTKADVISVQIQDFLRAMSGSGGPTIPHALKSDIVQLMLRFSSVRSRWVAQIVEYGIAEARLRDLHSQMRTLGRVYAHDDNTLDAFLDSAWKQLLTQSAQYTHLPTREAYCARAFLCMAQAFICGLKSGPAPLNPNVLDTLTGEAIGGGVGALGTGGASASSTSSGTPQGTVQWPLQGIAALPVPPGT